MDRWSTEGITETIWEQDTWVLSDLECLILFCKAKMLGDNDWQETRKISFFTARLASFSITQDSFCKFWMPCVLVSWHELSACQKLFPPKERHIDLPYKHWNMRRVLFLAESIGSGKIAYPNLLFLTGIQIELIHFVSIYLELGMQLLGMILSGGFSSASRKALWWHGSGTHSSGRRLRQAASVSTANILS